MFWFHKLWNFDSFNRFKIGLSLRTSAEYVPWFSAALFAFLVIVAFCTFISFSRCACEDPDSSGAFLVHGVICAGQISWVSGALAFWGLFCTVTLLFFTTPVLVVFSALSGCALVFFLKWGRPAAVLLWTPLSTRLPAWLLSIWKCKASTGQTTALLSHKNCVLKLPYLAAC